MCLTGGNRELFLTVPHLIVLWIQPDLSISVVLHHVIYLFNLTLFPQFVTETLEFFLESMDWIGSLVTHYITTCTYLFNKCKSQCLCLHCGFLKRQLKQDFVRLTLAL